MHLYAALTATSRASPLIDNRDCSVNLRSGES